MSRYTGPSWKLSRRLGISLTETGKELAKRPFGPGPHGQKRKKVSEYGTQLQAKQTVRFMYGLNEKQFRRLFDKAGKMDGVHGNNFLLLLESRLDNLVYRAGFAGTRRAARQLVNHGHVLLNGKKASIPSINCKPGDVITFRERSGNLKVVTEALENNSSTLPFVSVDRTKRAVTFERFPEMSELNQEINTQLIVEFYSR
ncbi:MAG: 30S ribosomal protein S4 [Mycoplasmatales bacterium]